MCKHIRLICTTNWIQKLTSGFKSTQWTLAIGSMSWSRVSLASWSILSFPAMPQWLDIQQKWTCIPLLLNNQRRFIIWQMKGSLVSSSSIILQAGHRVRVNYYIMSNHVEYSIATMMAVASVKMVLLFCNIFGHVATGCLTILEMAIEDCRFLHPLVHLGSVSVHFIIWSLSCTIRIEFDLGLLSGDHTFAHSVNEVVSPICVYVSYMYHICAFLAVSWVATGGRSIWHWSLQRPWLPLPWEIQDVSGLSHASSQILPMTYLSLMVWPNSSKAWCVALSVQTRVWDCNALMVLTDVPPNELHWSLHTY